MAGARESVKMVDSLSLSLQAVMGVCVCVCMRPRPLSPSGDARDARAD